MADCSSTKNENLNRFKPPQLKKYLSTPLEQLEVPEGPKEDETASRRQRSRHGERP